VPLRKRRSSTSSRLSRRRLLGRPRLPPPTRTRGWSRVPRHSTTRHPRTRPCRHYRRQIMEHLWSRADANAREPRQRAQRRELRNYLQTAASSCIRSPRSHGKEGVDGSSPSEGSARTTHIGALVQDSAAGHVHDRPCDRAGTIRSRQRGHRADLGEARQALEERPLCDSILEGLAGDPRALG
jgi:hypothetical protein